MQQDLQADSLQAPEPVRAAEAEESVRADKPSAEDSSVQKAVLLLCMLPDTEPGAEAEPAEPEAAGAAPAASEAGSGPEPEPPCGTGSSAAAAYTH